MGNSQTPDPTPRRGASARACECKKQRQRRLPASDLATGLNEFFTAGVEVDGAASFEQVAGFVRDFRAFVRHFRVSPEWGASVGLKFRKLGRHRADGLYYPTQKILVLDLSTNSSFAHEFGHLLDFRGRILPWAEGPSQASSFAPIHRQLLERMQVDGQGDPRLARRRGRLSWRYMAQPSECFARAFEQVVAEALPEPFSLAHSPSAYRADPLYLRELPQAVVGYFEALLRAGPPKL